MMSFEVGIILECYIQNHKIARIMLCSDGHTQYLKGSKEIDFNPTTI